MGSASGKTSYLKKGTVRKGLRKAKRSQKRLMRKGKRAHKRSR